MDNEQNQNEATTQETSGRPAARFSGTGGISVAVWKHKTDKGYDNYSIKIDRSYKKDDGEYETTPYLRDSDLLRTQKLLEQADDWIEQDKGRQRGTATGQSR